MNQDQDVNQSKTAGVITVILERLELNAVEAPVCVFFTPPGFSLPAEHPPEHAECFLAKSSAEYRVDDGITIQPVDIRGEFIASWGETDRGLSPVDAKELTFIIIQLGDWQKRWEYRMQL
jgi:hypothetical protein